jgi:CRISPR-associated protein Cas2
MFLVIAYDCTDDRRRLRLSKILLDYGFRVQYSVFEAEMPLELLNEMTSRIERVINKKEDSVRIYQICSRCLKQAELFGDAELTNQEIVYIV